jgi:hypothetical protein
MRSAFCHSRRRRIRRAPAPSLVRGGHGGGFPDVADRGQARAFGGPGATAAAEPERPHRNDVDGWIYFDGPAPELLRPLLGALRDRPPPTPEAKERGARQFFEKLDAMLSRRQEAAGREEGQARDAPIAPGARIAPSAPSAPPNAERRRAVDAATARSPTFADRSDTSPKAEPSAPEASGARATERVVGTEPVPDLPAAFWEKLGRLPFRPASSVPAVERTMPIPVMGRGQGETAPIREDSIAKAVRALPFAGNTVGAAIVLIRPLNLAQYASLRAELAVSPERRGEILPKYHVPNEAARWALDEHWAERLRGNGEEWAAFERAVGAFSAWLRASRGTRA